ncbi:hypothetical protein [Pseudoalteromonas sp.]|nr:hypothetical protein [Pseudoalteromonas sp.]
MFFKKKKKEEQKEVYVSKKGKQIKISIEKLQKFLDAGYLEVK